MSARIQLLADHYFAVDGPQGKVVSGGSLVDVPDARLFAKSARVVQELPNFEGGARSVIVKGQSRTIIR